MQAIFDNSIRCQTRYKIIKSKLSEYYGLNAHKWAIKMEVRNILSGKPDLKCTVTCPKQLTSGPGGIKNDKHKKPGLWMSWCIT